MWVFPDVGSVVLGLALCVTYRHLGDVRRAWLFGRYRALNAERGSTEPAPIPPGYTPPHQSMMTLPSPERLRSKEFFGRVNQR